MSLRSFDPTTAAILLASCVVAGCSTSGSDVGDDPSASLGGAAGAAGGTPQGAAAGSSGSPAVGMGAAGGVAPANTGSPSTGTGGTGAAASGGSGGSAEMSPDPGGSAGSASTPITAIVTVVVSTQLDRPTDLQFNPYADDELWIMNHGDSSAAIVSNASTEARTVQRRVDPEGPAHFMPAPTAFAFGGRETTIVDAQGQPVEGTFATCPESAGILMGPTLWTSDLRIFAIPKSEREPPFNGPQTGGEGPGSHIDMLHQTPACTGIAWEGAGNVYWTYSGTESMFVKYDFAEDHNIGNTDHTDASIWRYSVTGIGYVQRVPSHLAFDPQSRLLYMADTGNGRVVRFDPESATDSTMMSTFENLDRLQVALDMFGGELQEVIPSSHGLKRPSGLELHEQNLYLSDNETSTIHKFALDGTPLGQVPIPDVKQGGLAGLAFGPDGKLYFVDMIDNRVLRLENEF